MKVLWKNNEKLLLLILLAIALFLRLYKIEDYMTFLGDEGRDVLVVYNILHGHLTLLGPTASVGGFFFGPIYYYFMTPFLWLFNYDPVGPAVMVALFGTATVWLVYAVGSTFFSKRAGFIAAALYSISPLVIAYSRSSWNPNLMPFFSLLTIYALFQATKSQRLFLFLLVGVLYGIVMQLHYIELFLGVIIVLYIFLTAYFSSKEKKKQQLVRDLFSYYTTFFVGFLIGMGPFLLFEVRHGFPNTQAILHFVFSSGETGGSPQFITTAASVFFRAFARLLINYPPSEQIAANMHANIGIWTIAVLLLALSATITFILQFLATKDGQIRQERGLIGLWFFVGILLFGLYKKPIYDYYFEFLFPAPFLLVGNLLDTLYTKRMPFAWLKRYPYIAKAATSIIILFLIWINLEGIPFRFSPNQQKKQAEIIAQAVLDKSNGKPFNFALITGSNSDHAYRYFLTLWGHEPVIILNPQIDPKRTSVTDQLLVVCESLPCQPLGNSLWEIAGFGRAEIAGESDVSVVRIYKLVHYHGPQ